MSAAGTPEVERTYMPRCGLARADVRAGGSRSRGRTVITRPSRRGRGLEGPIGGRDLPPDAARDARTEPGTGLYGGTTPRRAPQTQPETRFRTWRPCRNSLPRGAPQYAHSCVDFDATATHSSNGICRAASAGSVLVAAGGSALLSSDR